MSTVNIAIDGPAGAGKSTIAKIEAEKLDKVTRMSVNELIEKLKPLT